MKILIYFLLFVLSFKSIDAQLYLNGDVYIQKGGVLYANDSILLASKASIVTNGILQSTKFIKTNGFAINTDKSGFIQSPIDNNTLTGFDIGTTTNNKLQLQHSTGSTVVFQMAVRDSVYNNPVTINSTIKSNIVGKTWIVQPLTNATNANGTLYWNNQDELLPFYRNSCFFSYWSGSNWTNVGNPKGATNTGISPAFSKIGTPTNLTPMSYYFSIQGNTLSSINGTFRYPNSILIPRVNLNITGDSINSNITSGSYQLSLFNYGNYIFTPYKNNDINKTNGVSTLDIVLVQSHILQKNLLNSPYKIIAADVNADGNISVLDIVYMKRLILGIDTTFTDINTKQNRLWAFVDSSYKFPDTTKPFPFKDSISYLGLSASKTNQTFIGCKLGDVNWDWNPAIPRPMVNNINAIELSYNPIKNNNTTQIVIPVKVKNFSEMLGMQFTISFNANVLQWQGIGNNPLGLETGTNHAAEGNVSFLWVDPKNEIKTLEDGSVLMELVFNRTGNCTNEQLDLNSSITSVAAYDKDYNLHAIIMNPSLINITDIVKETWTVAPNPTTDGEIHVQMNLKNNKTLVFRLSDNTGRILLVKEVEAIKGSNNINLREGNIPTGTYYLQAIGAEGLEVKKILVK